MGREAECACDWNGSKARVKALIEPPDLILRGGIRRRLPFSHLQHVRADGENLRFNFEGESVSLTVGSSTAAKWVKALTTPPPSLAKKLGITADATARVIGTVDDEALSEALSAAKAVDKQRGALIIARVDSPRDVAEALDLTASQLQSGVPIWFIYPKGRGQALNENDVRNTALTFGIVDTKIAAVSSRLTAIRFVKRRDS